MSEAGTDRAYFDLCLFKLRGQQLHKELEDRIEDLSAAAGPGGKEAFLDHWKDGTYNCARCSRPLYSSSSKWKGPCAWPSFRKALDQAITEVSVSNYNAYTCTVLEIYCGGCQLFIGHAFEDA